MSTETYEYEKINAKDKPVAEDFVYVYSEIEDGGFRKVSKEMLKMLLGVAVKISELENDSGFVTKIVSDLENYYLKSETYSKQEIDNKVSAIPKFGVKVVSSLPVTSISETTIYLVSNGDDSDNLYTEYINVNGLWEILGTQKIASVENAVLYTVQILTDEQKTQARTNIGAIGSEDIPKSLPASDVYSWAKQPEKPSYTASEVGALPDTAKIPTNTSDLTNNSGYITKTVNDLANYYLKSQTYSAEEIDNKISSIPKFSIEPVEQLPTSNISTTTVYLLKSGEETDNLYTEYIRVNGKWEYLGKQTVDLSGYVKKTELSDYYTETEIDSLLETIRNSIPTKLSQMTADATHRTVTDAEKQTWNNKSNFSGNYDDLTNKPSIPSLTGYAKESYVQEYAQPKGDYATNEKVSQLEEKIDDYIGEEIPDYWKEFIDGKESVIKEKLDEGGVDAFPILWGADIHGSKGASNTNGAGTSVTKNIGTVAKYTLDKYNIPFLLLSGDIMSQASHTSEASVHAEYEELEEILSPIDEDELLIEKGNHDGAWGSPVDGVYYLKNIGGKKIYNRLFRRQSLDRNRVFGGDGSYFYVDSPQNVRIIMLNGHTDGDGSVDADGNAVYNSMKNGVYGTEQLNWLCEVALNVQEGIRIIVSAHQPFSSSKDGTLLAGILEAYNKRTTYTGTINVQNDYWGKDVTDTTYTNISVNADFTEAKGKVVIYLHGHIHKDTIDTTTYSFPVVSITTAGADVRDTDPPLRTPNTATETALDFVIMSKTAINFIRIGAGSDRVIALDDTVYYSIKNNLTNVKTSNSLGNIVAGNSYSATISANSGYKLESVVVTMGGVDVTSSVYADGVITITEVTGNVVITASATKKDTDNVSYTNVIPLSTDADGNIYNGIGYKNNYRYNSSLAERENAGTCITGHISVKEGDTLYFSEGCFSGSDGGLNSSLMAGTTEKVRLTPNQFVVGSVQSIVSTYDWDETNQILRSLTIPTGLDIDNAIFTLLGDGEDAIITINEPITDGGAVTSDPFAFTESNWTGMGVVANVSVDSDGVHIIKASGNEAFAECNNVFTRKAGTYSFAFKANGVTENNYAMAMVKCFDSEGNELTASGVYVPNHSYIYNTAFKAFIMNTGYASFTFTLSEEVATFQFVFAPGTQIETGSELVISDIVLAEPS